MRRPAADPAAGGSGPRPMIRAAGRPVMGSPETSAADGLTHPGEDKAFRHRPLRRPTPPRGTSPAATPTHRHGLTLPCRAELGHNLRRKATAGPARTLQSTRRPGRIPNRIPNPRSDPCKPFPENKHAGVLEVPGCDDRFGGRGGVRPDRPIGPASADRGPFFSPRADAPTRWSSRLRRPARASTYRPTASRRRPSPRPLADAHNRGVHVEVILDRSQETGNYSEADFFQHAGITTYIDARHQIAHNKIMIIDGQVVVTGSFNFTKQAKDGNTENLLVIHDARLAARYATNWQEHIRPTPSTTTGRRPPPVLPSRNPIRAVATSPRGPTRSNPSAVLTTTRPRPPTFRDWSPGAVDKPVGAGLLSISCPPVGPGQVAQLVEHRTENPGVAGSIPALPTYARVATFHNSGIFMTCGKKTRFRGFSSSGGRSRTYDTRIMIPLL